MYVTWSGLVHSTCEPPVVLAEERDLAMESYLVTLGAGLVLLLPLAQFAAGHVPLGLGLVWPVGRAGVGDSCGALSRAPPGHNNGCGREAFGEWGSRPLPICLPDPAAPHLLELALGEFCVLHPPAVSQWCCLHSGVCG